jgi:hypothetical protein
MITFWPYTSRSNSSGFRAGVILKSFFCWSDTQVLLMWFWGFTVCLPRLRLLWPRLYCLAGQISPDLSVKSCKVVYPSGYCKCFTRRYIDWFNRLDKGWCCHVYSSQSVSVFYTLEHTRVNSTFLSKSSLPSEHGQFGNRIGRSDFYFQL